MNDRMKNEKRRKGANERFVSYIFLNGIESEEGQ